MTDTDDTDSPTDRDLEQRVEQLEQTVQQMLPSRRDALKLGGGALVGAGLMEATTGSAAAGSQSVGTIGTTSDPVDVVAEDFTDHNGNDVMELPGDGSVSMDTAEMKDGQVTNDLRLDDDPTDDEEWCLDNTGDDLRIDFKSGNVASSWLKFNQSNSSIRIGGPLSSVDLDLNGENINNVGSVSTDTATVNGTPENDPRELVSHVTQSGDGSSDVTASVSINSLNDDDYVIIEANRIRDDSGSGELQLEFSAGSDGDYSYTKRDGSGTYTPVSNANQFTLLNFTNGNSDRGRGIWTYGDGGSRGRIGLMGHGINTNRGTDHETLVWTNTTGAIVSLGGQTLEFTLTGNNATIDFDVSVFRAQQRGGI